MSSSASPMDAALAEAALLVNETMDSLLPKDGGPEQRLFDAMRYACMGGGKRLRPFLVLNSARLFNVSDVCALRVAAAVEMLHAYSLVHDDLPSMDDDDLRRGQPTCHRQFDEATAILAGDALLTQAFIVLAEPATHADPGVRAELVRSLGVAAGARGMVGGQMLDLLAENQNLDMPSVTRLQRMKTGALMSFSCEAGAILGKAPESTRQALRAYAHDLGLAFQVADDLLDVEGREEDMGKALRKDKDAGKATFVSLLGVERARAQAHMLVSQAVQHLELFKEKAELFKDVAHYVVERRT